MASGKTDSLQKFGKPGLLILVLALAAGVAVAVSYRYFGGAEQREQAGSDIPEVATEEYQAELNESVEDIQKRLENLREKISFATADLEHLDSLDKLLPIESPSAATFGTTTPAGAEPVSPPNVTSTEFEAQTQTSSGVPVRVLEDYQRETGVSPREVEELMSR